MNLATTSSSSMMSARIMADFPHLRERLCDLDAHRHEAWLPAPLDEQQRMLATAVRRLAKRLLDVGARGNRLVVDADEHVAPAQPCLGGGGCRDAPRRSRAARPGSGDARRDGDRTRAPMPAPRSPPSSPASGQPPSLTAMSSGSPPRTTVITASSPGSIAPISRASALPSSIARPPTAVTTSACRMPARAAGLSGATSATSTPDAFSMPRLSAISGVRAWRETPSQPRETLPSSMSSATTGAAMEAGTAKPIPTLPPAGE